MTLPVNQPETLAEMRAAFAAYEAALMANDLDALDALFWESEATIRYGAGENLYGIEAIRAFRAARSTADLARDLAGTVITTFGTDFATAATLFRRRGSGLTGRQMQTWVRTPQGWRVVAAHVSFVEFDFPD
jgi:ketosteroid isomerase-like protein